MFRSPRFRRAAFFATIIPLGAAGPLLLVMILLGAIGQILRDRTTASMLMMYIPLLLVGLSAIAFDLGASGRSLPKLRYGLCVAGLLAAGWGAWWESGHGATVSPASPETSFTIVQWNVWFGGGDSRTLYSWDSLSDDIRAVSPDIIVLNEAPPDLWLDEAMLRLGGTWRWTGRESWTKDLYRAKLAVCSPWPMQLENEVPLANGQGLIVGLTVHGRPLRIFVADGRSEILGPRIPLLHDVLKTCESQRAKGRPIDIITGDFNTISRSTGFDAFNANFALASRAAPPGSWRGTWPMPLPIFDIDHIWATRDHLAVTGWTPIYNENSDHRGQAARLCFR